MGYDYTNQRWIEGDEGTRLAIRQIDEELAIYEGPRGAEYRAMVAKRDTPSLSEIISALKANRARLTASLNE